MRWKRGRERESAIVRSTVSNGRFYGYCNRGFIKIDTNSIVSLQKIIVNSPRDKGKYPRDGMLWWPVYLWTMPRALTSLIVRELQLNVYLILGPFGPKSLNQRWFQFNWEEKKYELLLAIIEVWKGKGGNLDLSILYERIFFVFCLGIEFWFEEIWKNIFLYILH